MNRETHEMKCDGIGKFLKDYRPKYSKLEVIEANGYFGTPIGIFTEKKAKKKYGDWIIASIMDFNDTKTTSVILNRKYVA